MIIRIGSTNKAKVQAVKETILLYDFLKNAEVISKEVSSGVTSHPRSLIETINGAKTRAKNAFSKCDYSIGIEGGLIEVPETKTGYMEISACAIYDGKEFVLGFSSAFEWPIKVNEAIMNGEEASDAFYKLGLTEHARIGSTPNGAIGVLTKDRVNRIEYSRQSLMMALIQLEFPELYKK